MEYKALEISYDYGTFHKINECTWVFTDSDIITDKGFLTILGFQEVQQNGQVGIQMDVDGWLYLGDYLPSSPFNDSVWIRTLAIMRQPHNVWLWVYMFDENNNPVAAFCGLDCELDSFAKYVRELNRLAGGGAGEGLLESLDEDLNEDVIPQAEERVTDHILTDGKKYNGWGYYQNGNFIPHGCGKKFYSDFYVYGNFNKGVLNGPAINSHDHYMYTMFFNNNRGNGWGLCLNSGFLIEFGYYQDSELKTDLTEYVQWYYEGKLVKADRSDENMLGMYTSKETKEVTNLLIGYAPKKISETMSLACMGFRFKADGSVWVGTGNLHNMTGDYIHFGADGCIDIGKFEDGILRERMSLQKLIDCYFGTHKISNDDILADIFNSIPKSSTQLEREYEREQYRNIEEPKINFNYFTGEYTDDLPF